MKYLFYLLPFFMTCAFSAEPSNLDSKKKELIQYHDSGKYEKDFNTVIHGSISYLEEKLKSYSENKKPAIVLDIDETSLSNYPDMIKYNFGGTMQQDDDAEGDGHDAAFPSTLKLYQFAKKHQVAVFFITGRREHYRLGTERNLKNVGYQNWDGLILKPESYAQNSAAPYKIAARKQIESKGYDIILNVGDQESDLSGGHGGKSFKLPNPYYIVP